MQEQITKPKVQLTYEHIAHMHTKDFERGICTNDFIRKYSQRDNILQFMHICRSQLGLGTYDPVPEEKLDEFIRAETPFHTWKEFLVAAFEHQAAPDEIAALEDREFQAA